MDGNQKNNRQVCAAEEAGFVEYANLPGKVKTGCMETPEQKSQFCSLHKPREMKGETDSSAKHMVIESILSKKETRNATFYEVGCDVCEPCGCVCTFHMPTSITIHIHVCVSVRYYGWGKSSVQ